MVAYFLTDQQNKYNKQVQQANTKTQLDIPNTLIVRDRVFTTYSVVICLSFVFGFDQRHRPNSVNSKSHKPPLGSRSGLPCSVTWVCTVSASPRCSFICAAKHFVLSTHSTQH